MQRFSLSEVQAQAILDMQLKRLQGLERDKIENEYSELLKKVEYYKELLSNAEMLDDVLIGELEEIRDKYGDERKTEIAIIEDEIDIEDLIDEEDCVYTLTNAGYIKRLPVSTYRSQRRGGRGVSAQSLREEDFVETVFTASTHDYILFFTNYGKVYRQKGYMIPEAGRTAKGTNIINLLPIEQGEKVSAMLHLREFPENRYLVMVTRNGTVKRMRFTELRNIRSVGIRALNLVDDDELISVHETDGTDNILIVTRNGMAICFRETDVRPMGRNAGGVRGIKLREGDFCVAAAIAHEGRALLSVTENGFGKRTPIEEYLRGSEDENAPRTPQNRGGIGLKNYNITEKTGPVAAAKVVDEDDDILLLSDDGTIIRMAVSDISVYGRATQGVVLMRLSEGARVISLARVDKEDDTEDSEDTQDTQTAEEAQTSEN
jgi:DNA gyrase subunit A